MDNSRWTIKRESVALMFDLTTFFARSTSAVFYYDGWTLGHVRIYPRFIPRDNWFNKIWLVRNSSSKHTSMRCSVWSSVNDFGTNFAVTLFTPNCYFQIEWQEAWSARRIQWLLLLQSIVVSFLICFRTRAAVSFLNPSKVTFKS